MGIRSEQTFFQKRYTSGQQVYKKVLNIIRHQGNANQNQNEIFPTPVCTATIEKAKVLQRMWRKRNACILLVRIKIGTAVTEPGFFVGCTASWIVENAEVCIREKAYSHGGQERRQENISQICLPPWLGLGVFMG